MNQDNVLNSLPPFAIGQEVVCVKSHSLEVVKKGERYIIMGIKMGCCRWIVDVGKIGQSNISVCSYCGNDYFTEKNIYWVRASLFSPIIADFASISYSRVMEEEGKLVSSN